MKLTVINKNIPVSPLEHAACGADEWLFLTSLLPSSPSVLSMGEDWYMRRHLQALSLTGPDPRCRHTWCSLVEWCQLVRTIKNILLRAKEMRWSPCQFEPYTHDPWKIRPNTIKINIPLKSTHNIRRDLPVTLNRTMHPAGMFLASLLSSVFPNKNPNTNQEYLYLQALSLTGPAAGQRTWT